MSQSPSELITRVPLACANCRLKKIKCVTESQQETCMNCRRSGVPCEYVPMDKQSRSSTKASSSNTPRGGKKSSSTSFPQQAPINMNYGGYVGGSSPAVGIPQHMPTMSHSAYSGIPPYQGPGPAQYPSTNHGSRSYSGGRGSEPQMAGQAHHYGTRQPNAAPYMPHTNPATAPPPPQGASAQLPANYGYSVQEWNAMSQTL
ncbi:hypothetical protein C8R43DRAFT_1156043 [Mycena crocata]|nr:hypothetical protein C8R43DRAFT_1156043 [Mycena crocata]